MCMKLEKEIHMTRFESSEQRTWLNLLITANRTVAAMGYIFKKFGISEQQYNVLRILRGLYPDSGNLFEIRERMIDKSSNATRLVEKLRQKGLVDQKICEKNRRKVDIKITDKGMNLLSEMNPEMSNSISRLFVHLNDAEIQELDRLLEKFRG